MIKLNLVPDSKLEHIRSMHKQRKISALCFAAIAAAVALPIIMIVIWGGQKALLGLVQRGINDKIGKIQSTENIDQILTVQNQLASLPGLYDQRLYYTSLLSVLPKLLPNDAKLTSLTLDEGGQLELQGEANSAATINDFVNILEKASLREADGQTRQAFTAAVVTDIQPTDTGASFTLSVTIDQALLAKSLGPDLVLNGKVLVKGNGTSSAAAESSTSGSVLSEGGTGQ